MTKMHHCDRLPLSSYNERVIETFLRLSEAKIILIISLQLLYDHQPKITRHSKEHCMVVVGDKKSQFYCVNILRMSREYRLNVCNMPASSSSSSPMNHAILVQHPCD